MKNLLAIITLSLTLVYGMAVPGDENRADTSINSLKRTDGEAVASEPVLEPDVYFKRDESETVTAEPVLEPDIYFKRTEAK
ncbi:hypothetical protein C8J56DRAFT_949947 [Mycena floridula]|nr:hypothetical protein C8J56DRAFT_949947 [Mycena floridula]